MSLKIVFIGTGMFGFPIAVKLLELGHDIFVVKDINRAKNSKNKLIELGAKDINKRDISSTDLMVLCLPMHLDVTNILESCDLLPKIIVDLSTISPASSVNNSIYCQNRGTRYIDAPVSGSLEKIKSGNLIIFTGVSKGDFKEVDTLIEGLSKTPMYLRHLGFGSKAKLVNQFIHLSNMAIISEGIKMIDSLDLPLYEMVETLKRSSANSVMLSRFGSSILKKDTKPHFKLSLALKDMTLVKDLLEENNIKSFIFNKIYNKYGITVDEMGGDVNFSAIAVRELMKNGK